MEIYTQGIGEKRFSPEEIKINFNFKIHAKTYEQTLNEGIKKVDEFTKLLKKLNFKRETFKTLAFRVYEETKYDKGKQKDVLVGYIYNHDASLIFDYDMKRLSSLIQEISKLKDGPKANISFSLKNEDRAKSACIDKAYKNAKTKAEAIAKSAGKKLLECKKVSFESFDEKVESATKFNGMAKMALQDSYSMHSIENIIVPQDIEVSQELYCLWVAE